MHNYFISSCNSGGLYHVFLDKKIEKIKNLDKGNIRGLTQVKNKILYIKDDVLFGIDLHDKKSQFFKLPCGGGHDIKFDKSNKTLLFAGTQENTLYRLSLSGQILNKIKFDLKYWFNCICLIPKKRILIFLSCKRPNIESKIIILEENFNLIKEYECPEKDEIHSPFYLNEKIYWCSSNTNKVKKSDLNFQNIEEIITNNNGYTRGLYLTMDVILLGTSENRHAENSNCKSEVNCGCIHLYKNKKLIHKKEIKPLEIYDIIKYKHAKL